MFGTFLSKVAAGINYFFGSSAPAGTQAPFTMAATQASRYLRSSDTTSSPLSMITVSALDAAYFGLQVFMVLALLLLASSIGSTMQASLIAYRLQRDSLVQTLAAENRTMGELAEQNGVTIDDLNGQLEAINARHQRELDSASRQHARAIDGVRSNMQQQLDHARWTTEMDKQTIRHTERRLKDARAREEASTGTRPGAVMRAIIVNRELRRQHAADMVRMRTDQDAALANATTDHDAALLRRESMLKAAHESELRLATDKAEKGGKELTAANSENQRLREEVSRLQQQISPAAVQARKKREAGYKERIDILEGQSVIDKARIRVLEGNCTAAKRGEDEANARANHNVEVYCRELEARNATIRDQDATMAANNALYLRELEARDKMIADNNTLYQSEMVKRDATLREMKALQERGLAARDKKLKKQEQMQKRLLARISALQADNAALKESSASAGVPPPVPPPSASAVSPPPAPAVSPPPPAPVPSPLPSPLPTSIPLPASPQPAPAEIPLPPSPQPAPAEVPLPPSPQPAPVELPSPASPTPDAAAAPVADEPRAESGASSAVTTGQISEAEETPTAKTNAEVTEEAKKSPAEPPVAPEETVDQTPTSPMATEPVPELAGGVKAEPPAAASSSEAQETSTEEVTMEGTATDAPKETALAPVTHSVEAAMEDSPAPIETSAEEQPADDPMDTGLQPTNVTGQEAETQQPMDTEDAPAQPPAAANHDAEMTDGDEMIHPIGQDSQGDQDMFGSEYNQLQQLAVEPIDLDHLMGMDDFDLSTPTGFDFDLSDPAAFNFDWADPAAFNFDPAALAPAPIDGLASDHDVTDPVDQAMPMNDFDHWLAQFTGPEAASNDLVTQLDLDRILGPQPVVLAGTSDAHLAAPETSAHSDQPSNPGSAADEQSGSLPVISAEEQEQLDRDLAWQNLRDIIEGVRNGAPSAGPVETAPLPTSSDPGRVEMPREPNPSAQPLDTRSDEELARLPGGVVDQPPPATARRIAQPTRRRRGAGQQQQSGGVNWNIDPALLNAADGVAVDQPAPAAAAPGTGPGLGRRIANPVQRRRPAGYRPFPVNAPGPSALPPPQQQQQPLPLI
ncbi:MAG: hypothetical protein Q9173_006055, partial [Seirophora scorigena]